MTRAALLLASLALPAPGAAEERPALTVRASPAFAPCVREAVAAAAGVGAYTTSVEAGRPSDVSGADVVVGDDDELTATLEGGRADVRTALDLGTVPWVVLRGATREAVPLTAAAHGLRDVVSFPDRRPLVAVAAVSSLSGHPGLALDLVRRLAEEPARQVFRACVGAPEPVASIVGTPRVAGSVRYAVAVVDWWLPACSLERNVYNDPSLVLGPPDAANVGGARPFRGMMSLGQGGHVVVDLGQPVVDGPGTEIRVYQTTSGEPVTLYASNDPRSGFVLVGLQRFCGFRTPGLFSNHCDFDLADAGLSSARYLRIEDGEIYPCLRAGTNSEGADIDAVEVGQR